LKTPTAIVPIVSENPAKEKNFCLMNHAQIWYALICFFLFGIC